MCKIASGSVNVRPFTVSNSVRAKWADRAVNGQSATPSISSSPKTDWKTCRFPGVLLTPCFSAGRRHGSSVRPPPTSPPTPAPLVCMCTWAGSTACGGCGTPPRSARTPSTAPTSPTGLARSCPNCSPGSSRSTPTHRIRPSGPDRHGPRRRPFTSRTCSSVIASAPAASRAARRRRYTSHRTPTVANPTNDTVTLVTGGGLRVAG
jgi:hypothetical protein